MKKPSEVVEAVSRALCSFGGPGRGVHEASLAASEALYDARMRTAEFLGAPDASRVAFAANATAALNTAIAGTLPVEGRALTTAASHNSVLRPCSKPATSADAPSTWRPFAPTVRSTCGSTNVCSV